MLFVKRLLTALLLFAMIFTVLYVGAMGVGKYRAEEDAVANLPANLRAFRQDEGVRRRAGKTFKHEHEQTFGLAALGLAAVGAMWLSFGGVMSWCRESRYAALPANLRYRGGRDSY